MYWYMGFIWFVIFLISVIGGVFEFMEKEKSLTLAVSSLGAFFIFLFGLSSSLQCGIYILGGIAYLGTNMFLEIRKRYASERCEKAIVIFSGGRGAYGGCIVKYNGKIYPAVCRDEKPLCKGSVVGIMLCEDGKTACVNSFENAVYC